MLVFNVDVGDVFQHLAHFQLVEVGNGGSVLFVQGNPVSQGDFVLYDWVGAGFSEVVHVFRRGCRSHAQDEHEGQAQSEQASDFFHDDLPFPFLFDEMM